MDRQTTIVPQTRYSAWLLRVKTTTYVGGALVTHMYISLVLH